MREKGVNRLGCAEFREHLKQIDRRTFVRAGMLGAAGLAMSDLLRLEAQDAKKAKKANSVIILWMRGGPSQHETWDPKPNAPAEIRGAFRPIPTAVPGIQICELLPMSARAMKKWSIIRSLTHEDAGHSSGDQLCFTGYPAGPKPDINIAPSCGSVVSRQLGHLNPKLPPYVMIPSLVPGADAGWLGPAFRPFETQADPAREGPFSVPNLQAPEGISVSRLDDRKSLLSNFDQLRRSMDGEGQMEAMDEFNQRAWSIITGPEARAAFDLDAEPTKIRERYGFMPAYDPKASDRCGVPAWSQRMLLARRLVEAGVRLVTVDVRWWDTHFEGVETMRDGFLPRWDRAYTALIEDLEQRGLLETTMVVAWGEFGRSPQMNNRAGRDHWPHVFSAAVAGGGIQGGRVVGSSDDKGGYPKENPKSPQDVLATIYRHVGVDVNTEYLDHTGRPRPVLPGGKPIEELF